MNFLIYRNLLTFYKLVVLVHDLDSVRYGNFFNDHSLAELTQLNQFDYVITVNQAMADLLMQCGVISKLFPLVLFDYVLSDDMVVPQSEARDKTSIAYAGNLKNRKSPFVYKLHELDLSDIEINLFGPWLDKNRYISSEQLHALSEDDYLELRENALRLSAQLRKGYYIKKVINEIEQAILVNRNN